MTIERTRPLMIHKNLVIKQLLAEPKDLANIFPGCEHPVEQVVDYLRKHKGIWFVAGELLTIEEANAKYPLEG